MHSDILVVNKRR